LIPVNKEKLPSLSLRFLSINATAFLKSNFFNIQATASPNRFGIANNTSSNTDSIPAPIAPVIPPSLYPSTILLITSNAEKRNPIGMNTLPITFAILPTKPKMSFKGLIQSVKGAIIPENVFAAFVRMPSLGPNAPLNESLKELKVLIG